MSQNCITDLEQFPLCISVFDLSRLVSYSIAQKVSGSMIKDHTQSCYSSTASSGILIYNQYNKMLNCY